MVKVAEYVPERGDIVWIDFSPHRGHEQAHRRPAIVLSSKIYNRKSGMMVACPITSKKKHYPFEVELKTAKLDGVVLVDQIRSFDWYARKVVFLESISPVLVTEVQEQIMQLIKG